MPGSYVSTGISINLPDSGFTANIVDVQPPNMTREALNASHMLSTGFHKYVAAKLVEGGQVTLNIQFDPADDPPIDADPETMEMTFADGDGTSGSEDTTWAFQAFMTGYAPDAPLETIMTAQVTIKVADDIDFNATPSS